MKKNVLAVLIASSVGLYGCGNESELSGNPSIDPVIEKSLQAKTQIIFDILSEEKKVDFPSFFGVDTFDGTLASDDFIFKDGEKNPNYSENFIKNPKTAMGKTDGWGILEPITIDFHGSDLKTETANAGFVLIKSFNPLLDSDTTKPEALSSGKDYFVTTSGTKLIVSLLRPLEPSANYMFAITNHLKDADNNSVGMSQSYAILKDKNKPISELLDKPQGLVHLTENTIAATTGVNKDNIIFSTWFPTASAGNSLYATKAAIALATETAGTTRLFSFTIPKEEETYKENPKATDVVTKYSGTVKLPYYLGDNTDPKQYLTTPWSSATPSLLKILNVLKKEDATSQLLLTQLMGPEIGITNKEINALKENPKDKSTLKSVIKKLVNKKLYIDSGHTVQLDKERLITQYSPIPQLRSVADVPYNLYMPKPGLCSDDSNIPVSIFTHGFGGNKNSADNYAQETLSTTCQALIAIDLPLHGERWHGNTKDPKVQMLSYMNLESLPVARDNIRQSIADLVSLRTSLGLLFGAKEKSKGAANIIPIYGEQLSKLSLDTNDSSKGVGYVGVSLGGIVGIGYTATINKPVIFDKNTDSVDIEKETTLFGVSRTHFDVPGGGLAYFLFNSELYGKTIKTALKESDGYQPFKAKKCKQLPDPVCDVLFFNSFAMAAQTVLDTVDPANLINQIKTPIYLSVAEGDTVIPNGPITNSVVKSMVAGTLPLITNSKKTPFYIIGKETNVNTKQRNAALYKDEFSHHAAILGQSPNDSHPIADMQKKSITFLSEGKFASDERLDFLHPDIESLVSN
ncbi:lipase [uncultured Photobacterium sp.]|uniref:lipase n=1 Tax=uncultured Photobacterium sp. TaxID=173973 RepID=UPI002636DA75|nr:lipase [uncultured Photobacterium sp.]